MPAATPAAVPQASAPWAPCPNRVAPATSRTETTTATSTSTDDGGAVWMPLAGCAATRKTARPPVVSAAPNSSSRRGACRVRIARRPSATTSPTDSIGCTTATGATARAATWVPVPQNVAACPNIQRFRLTISPQAQARRRLAAFGGLVLQHRAHGEQHRRQGGEQQSGERAAAPCVPVPLHASRYAPPTGLLSRRGDHGRRRIAAAVAVTAPGAAPGC